MFKHEEVERVAVVIATADFAIPQAARDSIRVWLEVVDNKLSDLEGEVEELKKMKQ